MESYCLKMEVIMKANLWMEKSLEKATSTGPGQVSIGHWWAVDGVFINPLRVYEHTKYSS